MTGVLEISGVGVVWFAWMKLSLCFELSLEDDESDELELLLDFDDELPLLLDSDLLDFYSYDRDLD